MQAILDNQFNVLIACATLLAALYGIRKTIADIALTRAHTAKATSDVGREVREDERELDTRTSEANAALVASITAGWQVIAKQQQDTIASLEARIAALEAAGEDREQRHARELMARDNKIREYRDKLHAANNELAKAGLVRHLVEAGVFPEPHDDGIAEERRHPVVPPATVVVMDATEQGIVEPQ